MPKICYTPMNFIPRRQRMIEVVNDVIEEYAAQGFNLTLRQLYYQLVARDFIPNNLQEYSRLGNLVSDARMAGLIDWDAIIDRVRSLEKLPSWSNPASIINSARSSYRMDHWANQDYRIEVWVEKNAAVGIIDPVCRRLDIPYFACIGYTSMTALWEAAQRLRGYIEEGKTPIILHFGDHDPSGIDMTRDIRERLDVFLTEDCQGAGVEYEGLEVERLALNMDQVRRYNPPPNPAKLTDSRASGYIATFGDESWELDALSPSVVAALIESAVNEYRDVKKWEEVEAEEAKGKNLLAETVRNWRQIAETLGG